MPRPQVQGFLGKRLQSWSETWGLVVVVQAAVALEVDGSKVPSELVDRALEGRLVFVLGQVGQPALVKGSVAHHVGQGLDLT